MVAAEAPLLSQTHRSECGSYSPLSRSQDRTCQKQPDMRPDAFGEKWHEGGHHLYHRSGYGTHISITSFERAGDERTLPLSPTNGQSPAKKFAASSNALATARIVYSGDALITSTDV